MEYHFNLDRVLILKIQKRLSHGLYTWRGHSSSEKRQHSTVGAMVQESTWSVWICMDCSFLDLSAFFSPGKRETDLALATNGCLDDLFFLTKTLYWHVRRLLSRLCLCKKDTQSGSKAVWVDEVPSQFCIRLPSLDEESDSASQCSLQNEYKALQGQERTVKSQSVATLHSRES